MNACYQRGFGPVALIAAALLTALPAAAHTVNSRVFPAVVDTIDRESRVATFTPESEVFKREYRFRKTTRYVCDDQARPVDELRSGQKVLVYYRTPFFGRPILTRVVCRKNR
jgi:hypothetical protein